MHLEDPILGVGWKSATPQPFGDAYLACDVAAHPVDLKACCFEQPHQVGFHERQTLFFQGKHRRVPVFDNGIRRDALR
jgi:hypothetical protein